MLSNEMNSFLKILLESSYLIKALSDKALTLHFFKETVEADPFRFSTEENDRLCDAAIRSYQQIAAMDPSSPTGKYAMKRISIVRANCGTTLTKSTM